MFLAGHLRYLIPIVNQNTNSHVLMSCWKSLVLTFTPPLVCALFHSTTSPLPTSKDSETATAAILVGCTLVSITKFSAASYGQSSFDKAECGF